MNFLKSIFGGSSGVTSVNAADAKARLDSSTPPYIIDVRQPEEFKSGHLQNAHLIPLNQLEARINEVPQDREILCVCQSGSRSSAASRFLAGAGYTVLNLSGGMIGWQMARLPVKKGK